jgi:hypothetical protein
MKLFCVISYKFVDGVNVYESMSDTFNLASSYQILLEITYKFGSLNCEITCK